MRILKFEFKHICISIYIPRNQMATTVEQQLAELKTEVLALKEMIAELNRAVQAGNMANAALMDSKLADLKVVMGSNQAAIADEVRKLAEAKPASKKAPATKATESAEQPATSSTPASTTVDEKTAKEYFNFVWKTLKTEKSADKTAQREALRAALGATLTLALEQADVKEVLSKVENDTHNHKVASKLSITLFKMAKDSNKSGTGMNVETLVKTICGVKQAMETASKDQATVLTPEDKTPEEDA
jgi:hypothetical protein